MAREFRPGEALVEGKGTEIDVAVAVVELGTCDVVEDAVELAVLGVHWE